MITVLMMLSCPAPETLGRFPDWSTCCQQSDRCREHLRVLSDARRLYGHADGLWDSARAETSSRLDYWQRLGLCHQCESEVGLLPRRLQGLRLTIGYERFLTGWSPDPLPAPPQPMSRAENAAGR